MAFSLGRDVCTLCSLQEMLLQLLLGLSALPGMVLMQTYYINFVFNNNPYIYPKRTEDRTTTEMLKVESHILDVSSIEHSLSRDTTHPLPERPPSLSQSDSDSLNTDEINGDLYKSLWVPIFKLRKPKRTSTTQKSTTTNATSPPSTSQKTTTTIQSDIQGQGRTTEGIDEEAIEITTEKAEKEHKPNWQTVVPHPDDFFDYPLAKCHEDMDLHEVFGVRLEKDRGLAAKIYCNFSNSWGGPWLLMNRMELPVRLHMRHWFFGYVTDDFKDLNINFLGLAHLMNQMRIAMLILGQDNQDRLVYNLYDDVVISGFNDLFMLRKAHLVEANTTDLLFISVGDVLESYSGRNRTCPFKVLGSWWGHSVWATNSYDFCIFPVDRDINRPGYMAIFIKPSPFPINNTARYDHAITTRRPWVTTPNPNLMAQAKNNSKVYRKLEQEEFLLNKKMVQDEINRRINIYPDIEKNRTKEAQSQIDPS